MENLAVTAAEKKAISRILSLIESSPLGTEDQRDATSKLLALYQEKPSVLPSHDPVLLFNRFPFSSSGNFCGETVAPLSAYLTGRAINLHIVRNFPISEEDFSWSLGELSFEIYDGRDLTPGIFIPFLESDLEICKDAPEIQNAIKEWLKTLFLREPSEFVNNAIENFQCDPQSFLPPRYPVFGARIDSIPGLWRPERTWYFSIAYWLANYKSALERGEWLPGLKEWIDKPLKDESFVDVFHPSTLTQKFIRGPLSRENLTKYVKDVENVGAKERDRVEERYKKIFEILESYPPTVDPQEFIKKHLEEILSKIE